MIGPRKMSYSAIDLGIGISRAFGAKLPYRPMGAVLIIEEFDESVGRVSIGSLRKSRRGARGCNDCWESK